MRQTLLGQDPQRRAVELRAALAALPDDEREAWLDDVFGIDALVDDGPDLPLGCVPYIPCPIDVLLLMIDALALSHDDVFVDVGAGVGRVTTLVHLLTGARAIGVEVQAGLADIARTMARGLLLERVATVHADAADAVRELASGTVFFLYCPFSDARLDRVLDALEDIAATRSIRVCCVHMATLERSWLHLAASPRPELVIYRSEER